MISFDTVPRIVLRLENGLYIFKPTSGYGKTYMKELFKLSKKLIVPVLTYDLDDHDKLVDIEALVEARACKVLLVDRFDMYPDDKRVCAAIEWVRQSGIVLVDAKSPDAALSGYRTAFIRRTEKVIEVYS